MILLARLSRTGHRYLTRSYLFIALLAISIAQVALLVQYAFRSLSSGFVLADWRSPLSAALMLRSSTGSWVYDLPRLAETGSTIGIEHTTPYIYPPVYLLLILPFTALPLGPSNAVWMLFNVGLLGLSLSLLARTLIEPQDRLLFALLVGSSLPVGTALQLGQSTFILLLGLSLAVVGILRQKDLWTGLGLAALLIKPQFLPLWVLLLLWQRRFRALAYLALTALLLAALSWMLVGTEGLAGYVRLLTNGTMEYQYSSSHTLMGVAQAVVGGSPNSFQLYASLCVLVICGYGLFVRQATRGLNQNSKPVLAATVLVSMLTANYLLVYDLALWSIALALVWPATTAGYGRFLLAGGYAAPWLAQAVFQVGPPFVWPTVAITATATVLLYRGNRGGQQPALISASGGGNE